MEIEKHFMKYNIELIDLTTEVKQKIRYSLRSFVIDEKNDHISLADNYAMLILYIYSCSLLNEDNGVFYRENIWSTK